MTPGYERRSPILLRDLAARNKQANGRLAIHIPVIVPFVDLRVIAMTDIVIPVQWLRFATGSDSHSCT